MLVALDKRSGEVEWKTKRAPDVTIGDIPRGDIPSLERIQIHPSGKSRMKSTSAPEVTFPINLKPKWRELAQ